jgi:ankyrin repeat protein
MKKGWKIFAAVALYLGVASSGEAQIAPFPAKTTLGAYIWLMTPKHKPSASEVFLDPMQADLAHAACRADKTAIAPALKNGAAINGEGAGGVVPLVWAVQCQNTKGVTLLLDAGADPNHLMGGRTTPVLFAAGIKKVAVLEALLARGGDPNLGGQGHSPLMEAMFLGADTKNWDNYYKLIEYKADIRRSYGHGLPIAVYSANMAQFGEIGRTALDGL